MSSTTPELDEPIHVVPYDPAWAALGRALAERLAAGATGRLLAYAEHKAATAAELLVEARAEGA